MKVVRGQSVDPPSYFRPEHEHIDTRVELIRAGSHTWWSVGEGKDGLCVSKKERGVIRAHVFAADELEAFHIYMNRPDKEPA